MTERKASSLVLPKGRVEVRQTPRGVELWYETEQFGAFNGRTGWVRDQTLARREIRSKRLWSMALQEYYGVHPEKAPLKKKVPKEPKAPRTPKTPRPESDTLLAQLKRKKFPGWSSPYPDAVWVQYEDLLDVLASRGLTLRGALYHEYLRVEDKHIGQPRLGDDWDGYRILLVDVLSEPPSAARVAAQYLAGKD